MNTDKSLVKFKAISTFVNDIGTLFSKKQHSLKLYCHLINKTTLTHDKAIEKHIDAFTSFCLSNREGIISKDYKKFTNFKIIYSEKCFIDVKNIFDKADADSTKSIWKHLLLLSALLDPEAKAKEILKKDASNEGDFLTKILSKVEKEVDGKSNPMEAISSILQTGLFTDIVQDMNDGFKSGQLDMGKMMGTMQQIVGQIPSQTSGDGKTDVPVGGMDMNAMGAMMQNLLGGAGGGGIGGDGSEPPDFNKVLSMFSNITPPKPDVSGVDLEEIEDSVDSVDKVKEIDID